MDNMQRLESQISMYHTIFMICIVLFVLFLLVDIFLFIKLDIRKVIGFLTGKTARKTIEEMKAGGFGEKVQAAKETGAVLVAVGRPKETGRTFSEVCKWLEKNL